MVCIVDACDCLNNERDLNEVLDGEVSFHSVKKTYRRNLHDSFGQGETYIKRKFHTGAMANDEVQQPLQTQGENLPCHNCVLNDIVHRFTISMGGGGISVSVGLRM